MKRRLNIFAIAVIALALIFAKGSQPAHADGGDPSLIHYVLTCSSFFTDYSNGTEYISVALDSDHSDFLVGPAQYMTPTFSATFPEQPEGTLLYIVIGDGTNSEEVSVPCTNGGGSSSGSNEVTWCDLSDDGRIDGKCGDRIAIYCNDDENPPNLDVWVIDPTSVGHELAKLPLDDLEPSLTKNLGANGIINAGSDEDGNGWVSLSGGPYGGTGKGDWAKTFTCSADE